MNRPNPKFTITNRITAGLTRIERARGFLEAATLSENWVCDRGCPEPEFETNGFFTAIFRPNPDVRAQAGINEAYIEAQSGPNRSPVSNEVTPHVTPQVTPQAGKLIGALQG